MVHAITARGRARLVGENDDAGGSRWKNAGAVAVSALLVRMMTKGVLAGRTPVPWRFRPSARMIVIAVVVKTTVREQRARAQQQAHHDCTAVLNSNDAT